MKKIIITNGLIAGAIVSLMFVISYPLMEKGILDYDSGMITGYASMVIALSVIFFGIKTYRDQYQNGAITFGQGFKIGILIALIAGVMYALTWEVYYNTVAQDFTQKYTEHYMEKMKARGASEAEMKTTLAEMESFNELYKNPVVRFLWTLGMELMPVGLIITLISAAILRKREVLPA